MPGFSYRVEIMPSSSATDVSWLNSLGAGRWQLISAIPLTPIVTDNITTGSARGQVLCYFLSGSMT